MKLLIVFLILSSLGVGSLSHAEDVDPAEVAVGERLFKESRFAQYFFAHQSDINKPLLTPDRSMEELVLANGTRIPNPAMHGSVSCASCHMVDQGKAFGGMRSYGDFSIKSAVPFRAEDPNAKQTLRNSPSLVSIFPEQGPAFLHFDGEFTTPEDLSIGGFTGRNFGWLPEEKSLAVAHIARVIREDDGTDETSAYFGAISYSKLLQGTDSSIPREFRLSRKYRIDIRNTTDQKILQAVSKLVAAYMRSLQFQQDSEGNFNGSPYDQFLKKNALPRKPRKGESPQAYSERLSTLLKENRQWKFVDASDGVFNLHQQKFLFSDQELQGARIFFTKKHGNCVSCHSAPFFTDFRFHNIGVAQDEYDSVHGRQAFWRVQIPHLGERNANASQFASPVDKNLPGFTDLGLWNVWANPAMPKSQSALADLLCSDATCDAATIAARAIARFKTPGLRDLADSAPYFHSGRAQSLEEVVAFYVRMGAMARANQLRNPDPEMLQMNLRPTDIEALRAFLKSLTEDYE